MEQQDVLKVKKKSSPVKEAAVIIIQCSYRGHIVRKCQLLKKLKQLVKIREQADDVAKSIQALHPSSDYLKDKKQRLIIEESIMSLLLKLDTVQGLPPSYREVRKSVGRKLAKLQKMLDALIVNTSEEGVNKVTVEESVVLSHVLSTKSGEFNRKLMEENAMLKEQMGKLIEEGKEKTTLISNLSERVKILEQTTRQLCDRVFPL